MKAIILLLVCVTLSGCYKCAYGYSSSCGDTTPNQEEHKEKKDKPASSNGWN